MYFEVILFSQKTEAYQQVILIAHEEGDEICGARFRESSDQF